jgi:YfiH family protein
MIATQWCPVPGVNALCTTRGIDVARSLVENRRRLVVEAKLPADPRWMQQVHGTNVVDIDEFPHGEPVADAAVSRVRGNVCVVLTADCLPVLFAATDGSIVGAAHAGWRGLAAGVIENTVGALRRLAPDASLVAFLGPAISAAHFEVGPEVRDEFIARDAASANAFRRGNGDRWSCDLYQLARQRLAALGIGAVSGGGLCTYADEDRFFSHRRDVQHRGLAGTGRMASLIWRT